MADVQQDYDSGWPNSPSVNVAGDYSTSKDGLGEVFPLNKLTSDWIENEPLIGPRKLRKLHLFGLPLVSSVPDPLTGKPEVMDDTDLEEHIIEAVSIVELESGIDLFPKQYIEKHAFDKAEYDSMGYIQIRHRPISSIESMTVTPSNEQTVYTIPNEWIDVGYLRQGQINLIPLTIALKTGTVVPLTTSAGGATFLSIFGNRSWIASFFEIKFSSGFPNGKLPRIVNQLIGVVAAMEILSLLATTNSRSTSSSLSFDGISQSVSTPGPEVYLQRLKELGEKRRWLLKKLQRWFGLGILIDNV
jgi:hypothetical protein